MPSYNQIAGQRIGRIEALSDGIFAIAMTILVFDLKEPVSTLVQTDRDLVRTLGAMTPKFLSFFLSFLTLGIFWTGQTTQFHYLKNYDRNLNWITLFFLMAVCLLPFTTTVLSNHTANKVSILLYWLNILALGILIYVHWQYAKKHRCLALENPDIPLVDAVIRRRVLYAQSLYAFGALLCFVSTYLSMAFIIAVQLNYAFGLISVKTR